jgi:WD40 repeat protein
LWDVQTGRQLKMLQEHAGPVWSVAFHPDGRTLASGSEDETIKFWDIQTGQCLKTLRADRPYERMNITGVTGVTTTQKAVLKALGAVEDADISAASPHLDARSMSRSQAAGWDTDAVAVDRHC